ncbi:bacteriocin-processing peptidase family protein [Aeromicrobium ponti]|uniref:Tetratricopeptide repeat protein n=1 Tax=Cytobacillus oceanisediminis TaxID=665099 RepID=A0A562K209_9BACI|nr:tetratricopeptide repeat protein [Cytobacillus oceanisediminis]TWH89264.1 tetratricopeptide repeat protein [Cytobacillus oceanisediminis]
MEIINELKRLVENRGFIKALSVLSKELDEIKKLKLSDIKRKLAEISSIEEFQMLIQLFDRGMMYQYSGFLVRYAHRRFNTFQTAVWYCEELNDSGKALEADEIISEYLSEQSGEEDTELAVSAVFTKIHSLLEMKRTKEAEKWLAEMESNAKKPIWDKLGFFYQQAGDRAKAEIFLKKGLKEQERGHVCYLFLSDLYAANGESEESLSIIIEGIVQHPEAPALHMELIRRYRDAGLMDKMLSVMDQLDSLVPSHGYKQYFEHLRTLYFYQKNDLKNLMEYVAEKKLKASPFSLKNAINYEGAVKQLSIKPVIQKSNYCVPASFEMLYSYYGNKANQDEIAEHIFDVSGSKLSASVDFLEKEGFACRFFTGSEKRYKALLQKGIPIILSVDFEHSSHVQLMTGFDDRFGFYMVQDPNFLETMYVTYEEFSKLHINTSFLSIAAVPMEREDELNFLNIAEDQYYRELHSLSEKVEEDEKENTPIIADFLASNMNEPYTLIYAVKYFSGDTHKEFVINCAEKLLANHPESDFFKLHAAQAYIRLQEMDRAERVLSMVERKTFSPLYQFLLGRIHLYKDKYESAIYLFRKSLQLDPDQFYTWSYVALCFLYKSEPEKAKEISDIAMAFHEHDRFIRVNHALILSDLEMAIEARLIYDQLLREDKGDAHVWYERAKLDQIKGKLRKAERGFIVSASLEPEIPYPYLALADLYEYNSEDKTRAEEILTRGKKLAKSPQLLIRLGDFYKDHEEFEKAEQVYASCINHFPEEIFAYLGYAFVLSEIKRPDSAAEFLRKHAGRFGRDSEFLINGGKMFAEWAAESENISLLEEGLSLIERGFDYIDQNLDEALELYVNILEETPILERGISFLKAKAEVEKDQTEYLCYAGTLYESTGQYGEAIRIYEKVIRIQETGFPYYRLGETYFKLEQFERALEALNQSIVLNPTAEGAYTRLAQIYGILGDEKQEAANMLKLLDIAPLRVNVEYLTSLITSEGLSEFIEKMHRKKGEVLETWRLDSLAYAYGAAGDGKEEERCLQEALQLDPGLSEVKHHYSKFFIKKKKNKEARRLLEELIQENWEDEDLYETLIVLFAETKKLLQLPIFLAKVRSEKSEKSRVFHMAAQALDQYASGIDWENEQRQSLFGRVVQKMRDKTRQITLYGVIIDLYELSIKHDPMNKSAPVSLARFYESVNLEEDAKKVLNTSLDKGWDFLTAYQLVQLHLSGGSDPLEDAAEVNKAIKLLDACLEENPGDTHLMLLKAIAYTQRMRFTKAEELFTKILMENPYESEAHFRYGNLLNTRRRYEEAIAVMEEGLKIHPKDSSLFIEMGISYHKMKNVEKSLQLMDEVLAIDPDLLMARYNKACYLSTLHRLIEAEAELEYVLAHDEDGFFHELAEEDNDLINLKKSMI